MKEKQIKKWEKTRAKGFIRFVIKFALILSIAVTITSLLFDYYWDGVWKTDDIVFNFIFGFLINSVGGWIIYRTTENKYQESLNTKL